MHVFSDETIATVKAKAGIPPELQLFYESVWLEDGHTIQRHYIEDEAVLHAELVQDVTIESVGDNGNNIFFYFYFLNLGLVKKKTYMHGPPNSSALNMYINVQCILQFSNFTFHLPIIKTGPYSQDQCPFNLMSRIFLVVEFPPKIAETV